jgi:hypothetical protein
MQSSSFSENTLGDGLDEERGARERGGFPFLDCSWLDVTLGARVLRVSII